MMNSYSYSNLYPNLEEPAVFSSYKNNNTRHGRRLLVYQEASVYTVKIVELFLIGDIENWCREHCSGYWWYKGVKTASFQYKDDATHFKLVWG